MSSTKVNRSFRALEACARVAHVPGRSTYGLRRTMMDRMAELRLPPRVQEELAGWTHGSRMAAIYQRKADDAHRQQAAAVRHAIVRELSQKGGEKHPTEGVPEERLDAAERIEGPDRRGTT